MKDQPIFVVGVQRSGTTLLAAMLAGGAIVLGLGFAYLATIIGADKAWAGGVLPFLLADIPHILLLISVPAIALFLPGLM